MFCWNSGFKPYIKFSSHVHSHRFLDPFDPRRRSGSIIILRGLGSIEDVIANSGHTVNLSLVNKALVYRRETMLDEVEGLADLCIPSKFA